MLMRCTLKEKKRKREKKTDLHLLQVFSSVAQEWTYSNKIHWLQRLGIIHLLFWFSFCLGFSKIAFLEIYRKYNSISCLSHGNCLPQPQSPTFSILQFFFYLQNGTSSYHLTRAYAGSDGAMLTYEGRWITVWEKKTGKVFFLTFSQGRPNVCRERAIFLYMLRA